MSALTDFSDTIEALKDEGFKSTIQTPQIDRMVHEYIEFEDVYVTVIEQNGICSVKVEKYMLKNGGEPGETKEVLSYTNFSTEEELTALLKSTLISIFDEL